MTEAERAAALKNVQLELFQLDELFRSRGYHAMRTEFRAARARLHRKKAQIENTGTKECRKCREIMDVEQFYIDERYADRRYPYCIECKNRASKAQYHRRKRVA